MTRRRDPRITGAAVSMAMCATAIALAAVSRSGAAWTPLGIPIGIFLILALMRPFEPAPGEKLTLGAAVGFFAASVVPAAEAIGIVLSAAVITKLVQRASPLNVAVNASIQVAAAAVAAIWIAAAADFGTQLWVLVVAGSAYAAVTLAGVGTMVVAAGGIGAGLAFVRREFLPTLTLVSVGAIAALLWAHDVLAIVILAVPLFALERGLRAAARERGTIAALQAANEAQRQFAEDAAHELRTPLTALIGDLAFVGTESLGSAEAAALESARRTAGSLRRLTERLLTFSRAGPVAVGGAADLADAARDIVTRAAPRPGVQIRLTAPPTLEVAVAPELVRAILDDVIGNALAYTEAGRVDVELGERIGVAVLEVKDTGIGVAPGDLERVFDRFFRGARARSLATGSGLGLAIVRRIVESHGGSVTLSSAPDRGTTVRIELPTAMATPLGALAGERT